MAKPFKWSEKDLQKARDLAATVDKAHWLSFSGKTLLKIIAILAKGGSVFKPTASQVVDGVALLGAEFGWDMPLMTTPQERAFLMALVNWQGAPKS